jgi:TfoX/Sxy family transcriptional regulator of competence genes
MAYDEKTAARVRKALAGRRDVVEKKLMGGLCFMVNGNMCCSVSGKGGLLVRVDIEAMDRVLLEPHAAPMELGGRVMRGFARVAPDGYRTEAALKKWIERGVNAADARPPKAARKAKRAAPKKKRRVG